MKHTTNIQARIIYLILVFLSFEVSMRYSGIALNLPFYGIFFLMIIGYYLADILNFNRRYNRKDLIFSLGLNFLVFYVFFLFDKIPAILVSYLIFTALQNSIKLMFAAILGNRIKTVGILGENPFVEELIDRGHRYKFLGRYTVDNINNFNGYKLIYTGDIEDDVLLKRIMRLKMRGVKIMDSIEFIEHVEGKVDIENIDRNWVVKSSGFTILNNSFEQRLKRAFDLMAATIILLPALPLMLITYFLVKFDNPKNFWKNPAFFRQNRIGLGGETFEMVKFRSMRLHDPNEHSKYASKEDNRITAVGKFIRKTRLDELPQLWNVFSGDMSFVGPRPEWDILGREYEEKINLYKIRYAVKPGLTGWAQVMYPYGANLDDTIRKLEYDVYYIKHQNFVLDIIIFFKTVKTVLFGKGM